jgi:predicted small lipoprotein YifL
LLAGCGRKGNLGPDHKDNFPRSYPQHAEDTLKYN